MKPTVIYDSMNGLVWIEGQKSAGGQNSVKFYGKDARRFKSNAQTRSYALKVAREKGGIVYDKYFGKYLEPKQKQQKKPMTFLESMANRRSY